MGQVVVSLVLMLGATPQAAGVAVSGAVIGQQPEIRACALLTRELAMKVSGAANKLIFDLPPRESPIANGKGTECVYADITLQIDRFPPDSLESMRKATGNNWEPVSGVGDAAYFRANRSVFAELMGRAGRHTFFIQLGVPFKGTPEGMKPNTIELANAIVLKLR
jgi:hypothetical protein